MTSDGVSRPDYRRHADSVAELQDTISSSFKTYQFPYRKLKRTLNDPSRTPLVLVACGSYSPPTFLHLRLFEIAADYVRDNTNFEVIGGYLSPVNSNYKKEGLVDADARIEMCHLATIGSDWVSVDDWEALAPAYIPTAQVLDHFDAEISKLKLVDDGAGNLKPVRIALLAGADLISTFTTPGLWEPKDLDHILSKYGCFILERAGANIDQSLEQLDKWISNIWYINQPIVNDVSSTKIRLFLKKDMSIRYLIPNPVIQYIYDHGLYNTKAGNGHEKRPPE